MAIQSAEEFAREIVLLLNSDSGIGSYTIAQHITARDDAIRAEERTRAGNKARDFAAHYSPGTDGRNTFIIFAEWVESGARAPSPAQSLAPAAARPLDEWHEDFGPVLWWFFPIVEPPYAGTPLDSDWPGCHTHWTPITVPGAPAAGERSEETGK